MKQSESQGHFYTRIVILCTEVTPELYEAYRCCYQPGPQAPYKLILVSDKEPNEKVKRLAGHNSKPGGGHRPSPAQALPALVYYNNQNTISKGFWGATSFLKCCAWDKALRYLIEEEQKQRANNVTEKCANSWLIEDDVFFGSRSNFFTDLIRDHSGVTSDFIHPAWIKKSIDSDPKWSHWMRAKPLPDPWKKSLSSSLNVICRLSNKLIRELADLNRKIGRFVFHEILFATVVKHKGLTFSKIGSKYCGHLMAGHSRHQKDYNAKTIKQNKKIIICHPCKGWWHKG